MSSDPRSEHDATGWRSGQDDDWEGLAEFIDEHREDLEELADEDYPISRGFQMFLDRRDRGEL